MILGMLVLAIYIAKNNRLYSFCIVLFLGNLVIESSDTGPNFVTGSLIFDDGTPNATVQRYVEDGGWHFVSSAVDGIPASVFLNPPDMVWLTELQDANNYVYITDETEPLNRGQGYSYWIEQAVRAPKTVEFAGTLTPAASSESLFYDGTDDLNTYFTLLGNPYTSTIDLNRVADYTATGIVLTVWIWYNNGGTDGWVVWS